MSLNHAHDFSLRHTSYTNNYGIAFMIDSKTNVLRVVDISIFYEDSFFYQFKEPIIA